MLSLISTGCDVCTTPPLYCTSTVAVNFLFSFKLVNVALTLLPSADMPVALTHAELLQTFM